MATVVADCGTGNGRHKRTPTDLDQWANKRSRRQHCIVIENRAETFAPLLFAQKNDFSTTKRKSKIQMCRGDFFNRNRPAWDRCLRGPRGGEVDWIRCHESWRKNDIVFICHILFRNERVRRVWKKEDDQSCSYFLKLPSSYMRRRSWVAQVCFLHIFWYFYLFLWFLQSLTFLAFLTPFETNIFYSHK